MKIKQCVVFPILIKPDLALSELCRQVADIGYVAIEMWGRRGGGTPSDYDLNEVVGVARENGMRLVSMCGHGTLENGCNNPDNHDRIVRETEESIALAVANEVPNVIAFVGNRQSGQSDLEGMVECARVLRRMAPIAEDSNININIELLNSRIDHPGYLGDHTDWGVALCEMVASSRIKLLFDIYHMQIMEGDVIRSIRHALPHIGHFHTAGNPGRHDLDNMQELNYRGICEAIASTNYDGYVGHEFRPKADILTALKQAFDLCNVAT